MAAGIQPAKRCTRESPGCTIRLVGIRKRREGAPYGFTCRIALAADSLVQASRLWTVTDPPNTARHDRIINGHIKPIW